MLGNSQTPNGDYEWAKTALSAHVKIKIDNPSIYKDDFLRSQYLSILSTP